MVRLSCVSGHCAQERGWIWCCMYTRYKSRQMFRSPSSLLQLQGPWVILSRVQFLIDFLTVPKLISVLNKSSVSISIALRIQKFKDPSNLAVINMILGSILLTREAPLEHSPCQAPAISYPSIKWSVILSPENWATKELRLSLLNCPPNYKPFIPAIMQVAFSALNPTQENAVNKRPELCTMVWSH